MDRGVERALLLGGVLVPAGALALHPGVTADPPAPMLVAAGLLALLGGFALLAGPHRVGRETAALSALLAAGGLLGWAFLSAGRSLDPYRSSLWLATWTGAVGVMAAVALGAGERLSWRWAARGLVLAATAECLWGMALWIQAWSGGGEGGIPRLSATFTNADCFSMVPLGGLLLAAGLMARATRGEGIGLLGASLVMGLALLLSQSRAGLVGAAAGIAFYLALILKSDLSPRRRVRAALLVLAPPLLLLALLVWSNLGGAAFSRWALLADEEGRQGVQMRLEVLRHGLPAALEHPWLGSGPGTFGLAFQKFRQPGIVAYVNVAHNDYVEMAVENGLPGAALLLGLLGVVLGRGAQAARRGRLGAEAAGATAAVAGMAVYAGLNFAVAVPADLFWWTAAMGLALAPAVQLPKTGLPQVLPRLLGAGLMLAGGTALLVGGRAQMALEAHRRARALQPEMRWEEAYREAGRAVSLEPGNVRHRLLRAELANRLYHYTGDPVWRGRAGEELEAARRASPRDPAVWISAARHLAAAGKAGDAEEVLREALGFAPSDLGLKAELAALYLKSARLDAAARMLLAVAPFRPQAVRGLAAALAGLEAARPESGAELLREAAAAPQTRKAALQAGEEAAERLLTSGYAEASERLFAALVREEPSDPCFRLGQLRALEHLGEEPAKAGLLEEILAEDPPDGKREARCYQQAMQRWAELLSRRGEAARAERRLREELEENPWNTGLRLVLCDFYVQQGRGEKARQVIRQGLNRSPGDPTLLTRAGELYQAQGFPELALRYYRRALQHQPHNAALRRKVAGLEGQDRPTGGFRKPGSPTPRRPRGKPPGSPGRPAPRKTAGSAGSPAR